MTDTSPRVGPDRGPVDSSPAPTATDQAPTAAPDPAPRSLRVLTVLLAVACGVTVANLYYAQPLLDLIAGDFRLGQGTAALMVTLTQLGYAAGLLLLAPLGDLLENRALASRTLLATAAALFAAAAAPDFGVLLAASVLIGVTSVVVQILVPLAAHLAPAATRGRLVGRVMSGLLLGILLARTFSSLVAAHGGWRSIYVVSGVLMLALSLTLARMLPHRRPAPRTTYPRLMASIVQLVRTEPVLRRRAVSQALMFGAFSSFWTSIAYQLIDVHHFSQTGVGVFALVGAAGAAAAPIAGRLGDHGHGWRASGAAVALGLVAIALAGFGAGYVVLLAAGGVLLDLAVQGHQVLSQQEIYQLRPDARARVNTVFMTTVFVAGAAASGISGALHERFGWGGVSVFTALLLLANLLIWLVAGRSRARRRAIA
ncbi:MFS transporter [Micromonospora sp. NPDC049559]|uniref:MFS transporter n=1 Tax=Micromonospora sp. NPDC049559 TaxID=3155923 RepID=UPI00341F87C7